METEAEFDTPCSSMAVDSILRVGTAGVLWGLCTAPHDAAKLGVTGFPRACFVAKSMGKAGAQCDPVLAGIFNMPSFVDCVCVYYAGFFAGIFAFARCGIQKYRGKTDLINSAAAGAIAGAVIAASTRSRKHVAVMAALLSVVCAAGDYSRTF